MVSREFIADWRIARHPPENGFTGAIQEPRDFNVPVGRTVATARNLDNLPRRLRKNSAESGNRQILPHKRHHTSRSIRAPVHTRHLTARCVSQTSHNETPTRPKHRSRPPHPPPCEPILTNRHPHRPNRRTHHNPTRHRVGQTSQSDGRTDRTTATGTSQPPPCEPNLTGDPSGSGATMHRDFFRSEYAREKRH